MKRKRNLLHYLIRITSQHVHLRTRDSESNTRVSESNDEGSRIIHVFSSFGDGTELATRVQSQAGETVFGLILLITSSGGGLGARGGLP
jgi:hypothetical protein